MFRKVHRFRRRIVIAVAVPFAASPSGVGCAILMIHTTAKIWSALSGECVFHLEGHGDMVNSAGFSPDGQQVLTASDDTTAKLWSAASGECLLTFEGYWGCVIFAAFSMESRPRGGSETHHKVIKIHCF